VFDPIPNDCKLVNDCVESTLTFYFVLSAVCAAPTYFEA
jgi:hypothetical protein